MKYNYSGLSTHEVEKSKKTHGTNDLSMIKVEGFFPKLKKNLKDPIIIILNVALVLVIVLSIFEHTEWYEALAIAAAVVLSILVSTLSEYKNENSFQKLQHEASKIKCNVFRDGKIFQQEYEKGKPLYLVKEVGTTKKTGTNIRFMPDNTVFIVHEYNFETVAARLRELAFLNAGIRLTLEDRREIDDDGNFIKVKGQGVTEEMWNMMLAYALENDIKGGNFKKLNLPFENKLLGQVKAVRERMAKRVEDFVFNMLVNVLNAEDTARLAIDAINDAGTYDPGPKVQRIEDPSEWTPEKIRKRAAAIESNKGPEGDFDD